MVSARNRDLLERRVLLAARALVDRMRTLYRELERLTGAPIAVHRALACIGEQPGIVASRLAVALGMRRPALSHVLRGLVEGGWVERVRSDSDQRSVHLHLTSAGRQLLGATAGRAVGTLQRAVRRLPVGRLEGLADGLEGLVQHLPSAPRGARAAPQRGRLGASAAAPARAAIAVRSSHSRVHSKARSPGRLTG